jgi:hypothetical protein
MVSTVQSGSAADRNIDLGEVYHAVDDYIDKEVEETKLQSRAFRRAWVPVIKNVLASGADIIGDWVFYLSTKNGDNILDEFETPLYLFCLVSSVFGFLAISGQILNNFPCFTKNESKYKKTCMKRLNYLLGLEIFCEDIPQMILTALVVLQNNGGAWTPVSVFNVTTSAFNFTFNILDMMMPLEEAHVEGAKND